MSNLRTLSLLAIALAITLRYTWNHYTSTTYCYESIYLPTTASPIQSPGKPPRSTSSLSSTQPNCLSLSRSGTIKSLSHSTSSSQVLPGHILPGLWDGHGHILQYGEMLHSVDLFGSSSLADVRERLVTWLGHGNRDKGTRENWIKGIGWDQASFPEGRYPTAADLEKGALRGKFVVLDRVDVHCIWVSQAVLNLLPRTLPDKIEGGEIVRDPGLGVFCDNAIDVVRPYMPVPSREKKKEWLGSAMRKLNEVGIVGVHDAGVAPDDVQLYEDLLGSKDFDWTLRIYAMLACNPGNSFCPSEAKKISTQDHKLTVRSVKLFADGALGSWGSAMIEPYSDKPEQSGSLLVNSTTLTELAVSWVKEGYQVNIHAIGDLANRNTINALEAALRAICPSAQTDEELARCQKTKARFRIEHSQIIHPSDQERMHKLGLIPSIQPTHATSDMAYAESRLGSRRLKTEAYRMRSLLPLQPILGSDFPVEPPNPFHGMYAAVTRKSPKTGKGVDGAKDGWMVDEALSLPEAIKGFTENVARGAFLERKVGELVPGAVGDWIVVDEDLAGEGFDVEKLRKLKVRETWVGGRMVYKRKR